MTPDLTRLRRSVHAACRDLGLDDEARRDAQMAATGRASMTDFAPADYEAMLAHLRARGWRPAPARRGRPAAKQACQRKVYALWGELRRRGVWREDDAKSLWRFAARVLGHGPRQVRVEGVIGLMQPEALGPKECNKVIEALKDIGDRAGLPQGWDRG